jgi:hypothetical protein
MWLQRQIVPCALGTRVNRLTPWEVGRLVKNWFDGKNCRKIKFLQEIQHGRRHSLLYFVLQLYTFGINSKDNNGLPLNCQLELKPLQHNHLLLMMISNQTSEVTKSISHNWSSFLQITILIFPLFLTTFASGSIWTYANAHLQISKKNLWISKRRRFSQRSKSRTKTLGENFQRLLIVV